jgi:O-antigen chain-terminating methyltransferase
MRDHLPVNVSPFVLPHKGKQGIDDSERFIEIPWALSLYSGEPEVLDVGYAHAEQRYIDGLLALGIPHLHGLDLVEKQIDGIIPHVADIRNTPYKDNFFDLIFCISTIEHIGRDISRYTQTTQEITGDGDFETLREMYRITKPGGKIILTVPYGREADYGWLIQYSRDRFRRLLASQPLQVLLEEYFIYSNGWHRSDPQALAGVGFQENNARAAVGLACVLLKKRGENLSGEEVKTGETPREKPADLGIPVPALQRSSPSGDILEDRDTENEYIGRYLDFLARTWDIQNDSYHISSHQPVIGPVLVRGRHLVNDEVRRYIDPVISQQTQFNANTLRILTWMHQRIRDLEMQLEEQKKVSPKEKNNPDLPDKK